MKGYVGLREVLGIMTDKILSIAGILTMNCASCNQVTVTMLCHLYDAPNKNKFGHENCSGKVCGHKLVFISDDKGAQSNYTVLTKWLLDVF
jgi:hypothetical protein